MKFTITTRKITIKDEVRDKIYHKLSKLDKFFNDEPESTIVIKEENKKQYIEVTIFAGGMIYRAEQNGDDVALAIDGIVDIIERQIRKNKTRLEKKIKKDALSEQFMISGNAYESDAEDEEEFKIVRKKKFSFKPMSVEEAILQMNLLGHQFFVYQDSETEKTNVVYKRKDGNYALIETE